MVDLDEHYTFDVADAAPAAVARTPLVCASFLLAGAGIPLVCASSPLVVAASAAVARTPLVCASFLLAGAGIPLVCASSVHSASLLFWASHLAGFSLLLHICAFVLRFLFYPYRCYVALSALVSQPLYFDIDYDYDLANQN